MFKMLGAAVAAVALSFASQASAAIFWSGVVNGSGIVGELLTLSKVAGLYTFESSTPFEAFILSSRPHRKYHLHSDGIIERGSNWNEWTWDGVGKPEPVITLTATGFTIYVDPPQNRTLRTDLDVCDEWWGCGYSEVWEYRTDLFLDLQFAPGNEGQAVTLYFEPGPPQSAVPEPATWAMMIVGFGAVGSMVRTSRRRSALSAA